jgi:hypothetical protein
LAERAQADTPLVTRGPGMLTDVVQPPNGPAITIVRITAGFDKVKKKDIRFFIEFISDFLLKFQFFFFL